MIDMLTFIMEEGAQGWDAQPLEVRPYNMLPVIFKTGGEGTFGRGCPAPATSPYEEDRCN